MFTKVKSFFRRLNQQNWMHYLSGSILLLSMQTELAFGATGVTVDHFITTLKNTFMQVRTLMVIVAYGCGMGFMMMGMFKLKAHRDNPAQIPLSTAVVLMVVATGLLFLPTVFELAGSALFGELAQPGMPLRTLDF